MWIEVKVRINRLLENGKTTRATECYLADALSCTEAEARVIEELAPSSGADLNVLSVNKTKIAEIFRGDDGDKWYKVKYNIITIDEKTASAKKSAVFALVQAESLVEAIAKFEKEMATTIFDYEIETVAETKIMDVYSYRADADNQ